MPMSRVLKLQLLPPGYDVNLHAALNGGPPTYRKNLRADGKIDSPATSKKKKTLTLTHCTDALGFSSLRWFVALNACDYVLIKQMY